jgi:hypothetical protein
LVGRGVQRGGLSYGGWGGCDRGNGVWGHIGSQLPTPKPCLENRKEQPKSSQLNRTRSKACQVNTGQVKSNSTHKNTGAKALGGGDRTAPAATKRDKETKHKHKHKQKNKQKHKANITTKSKTPPLPPLTSWYHLQAAGLMGSPAVPSSLRLPRSWAVTHPSPCCMRDRMRVGAVKKTGGQA